ncbi:hypothetical protein C8J56DRAFT_1104224, partial [Mycena floridula]
VSLCKPVLNNLHNSLVSHPIPRHTHPQAYHLPVFLDRKKNLSERDYCKNMTSSDATLGRTLAAVDQPELFSFCRPETIVFASPSINGPGRCRMSSTCLWISSSRFMLYDQREQNDERKTAFANFVRGLEIFLCESSRGPNGPVWLSGLQVDLPFVASNCYADHSSEELDSSDHECGEREVAPSYLLMARFCMSCDQSRLEDRPELLEWDPSKEEVFSTGTCASWQERMQDEMCRGYGLEVLAKVRVVFVRQGHQAVDAQDDIVRRQMMSQLADRVTVKHWTDCLADIQSTVVAIKHYRIEQERREFMQTRTKVVRVALSEYQKQRCAATWQCYPPLSRSDTWIFRKDWPLLHDLVTSERFVDPEAYANEIRRFRDVIPECVAQWHSSNADKLVSLFPSTTTANSLHQLDRVPEISLLYRFTQVLNAQHLIYLDKYVSTDRGMDFRSSRARSFDEAGLRFVCRNCPATKTRGREVRDWRESVNHFLRVTRESHLNPAWGLLTPEFTKYIKVREEFSSVINRTKSISGMGRLMSCLLEMTWTMIASITPEYACTKCPGPNPRCRTLQALTSHLKLKHNQHFVSDDNWHKLTMISRIWP